MKVTYFVEYILEEVVIIFASSFVTSFNQIAMEVCYRSVYHLRHFGTNFIIIVVVLTCAYHVLYHRLWSRH